MCTLSIYKFPIESFGVLYCVVSDIFRMIFLLVINDFSFFLLQVSWKESDLRLAYISELPIILIPSIIIRKKIEFFQK